MATVNRDPIKDIRKAVSVAFDEYKLSGGTTKEFIDLVVVNLPDFFRQPLTAAEPELSSTSCQCEEVQCIYCKGPVEGEAPMCNHCFYEVSDIG
jgi:hypothetical protein